MYHLSASVRIGLVYIGKIGMVGKNNVDNNGWSRGNCEEPGGTGGAATPILTESITCPPVLRNTQGFIKEVGMVRISP